MTKPWNTLCFPQFLAQPWLDRGIAFIAMVPFVYLTYYRYQPLRLGIPLASFAIGTSITFVTMILRRPPKRVTPNPLYWLLTFFATYWALLTRGVMQSGRPVMASLASDVGALCSLVVIVWARLSLGRNIGFVPAHSQPDARSKANSGLKCAPKEYSDIFNPRRRFVAGGFHENALEGTLPARIGGGSLDIYIIEFSSGTRWENPDLLHRGR